MRDSVPSASYSSVCNVLRQWSISLTPTYSIDSIVKGLETSHVRPLKRVCVTNSTGNPPLELSQFRAPEKERTQKIKEEDASSRSYEIFNNRLTFWK